jgi:hypothetical protein
VEGECMSEDSLFWTTLFFGTGIGYVIGCFSSDCSWEKRLQEDAEEEQDDWVEVIPKKHIKRRRYS